MRCKECGGGGKNVDLMEEGRGMNKIEGMGRRKRGWRLWKKLKMHKSNGMNGEEGEECWFEGKEER